MKKLIIAALITLLALAAFGCSPSSNQTPPSYQTPSSNQTPPSNQTPSSKPATSPTHQTDSEASDFQPNLGGIKLGDSREKVIQSFGRDYKETVFDEDVSLGEPFVKLQFNNGIMVVLGAKSNSVLEIEASSPKISNNLDVRIGDKAKDVLDKYRSKYKEAESHQGDGKLIGWFLINDQQELVIFDFDKDESWGNVNIKPDAQVERIRLTNFKYMD